MNTKALIAYIAALIVILILAFIFLPTARGTIVQSTTVTPNSTTQQSTALYTSASTTTISNYSSCLVKAPSVIIPNGNFSNGTFQYWNSTGLGFNTTPTNLTYANQNQQYIAHPWTGYNGTFFATNYHGGTNIVQGNLTSNAFAVTQSYLNFKLISPANNQVYVEILVNGKPAITEHYNTYAAPNNSYNGTSTFINASINMIPVLCQQAQIRLVAGATGTTANEETKYYYLAATGFYLAIKPLEAPGIKINQSITI